MRFHGIGADPAQIRHRFGDNIWRARDASLRQRIWA